MELFCNVTCNEKGYFFTFVCKGCFSVATKLSYNRVVQLLHSCGSLFKIIRICGPQPAKNSYFCPKIRVFSKKKKVFTWHRSLKFLFLSQNHSVLHNKKVAAACDRQDLCKIVPRAAQIPSGCGPRAPIWTTLSYNNV